MQPIPPPIALTIAGSDPSGGAGLQADLKVFHQVRVFGTSVVTLITAQNTGGVSAVQVLSPEIVSQQLQAVLSDVPPRACKTGALGSSEIMEVVAQYLRSKHCFLVVDPVMMSKHGHPLMDQDAITTFRKLILPIADLITPNRFELQHLTGRNVESLEDAVEAARCLRELGAKNCLLKLGCIHGVQRLLALIGDSAVWYTKQHLATRSLHGTGCVLSANITARLALDESLADAIESSVNDTHHAIETAALIGNKARSGTGFGPIDMHFSSNHS